MRETWGLIKIKSHSEGNIRDQMRYILFKKHYRIFNHMI